VGRIIGLLHSTGGATAEDHHADRREAHDHPAEGLGTADW
jgi:hypothetical protein